MEAFNMVEEAGEGRRPVGRPRLSDDVAELRSVIESMRAELADLREREAAAYRPSRDQELRTNEPIHEDTEADAWEEPALLDARLFREALPGQALLWVRTHVGGTPDQGNVFKAMNDQWRPVLADSLPRELRGILEVDFRDQQVVGVHGMVLMQRPLPIHAKRMAARKAAADGQMAEVERRLRGTKGRADVGFGAPKFETHTVRVERGHRPAPVDAD